jgi:hypothetical protein
MSISIGKKEQLTDKRFYPKKHNIPDGTFSDALRNGLVACSLRTKPVDVSSFWKIFISKY